MPLSPAIAAALTTPSARTWGIWVGGTDVSKEPTTAPRYGVLWEETSIDISAPGSASGATIVIDDTQSVLTFSPGDPVYWLALGQTDLLGNTGAPWFRGQVDVASGQAFGLGRKWTLTCIGIDAVPDWAITTYALTFDPAITPAYNFQDLVQGIVAATVGIGSVSVVMETTPGGQGDVIEGVGGARQLASAVTIPVGTTLRQALELAASACNMGAVRITVDMYGTLRTYIRPSSTFVAPDGNPAVTVSTSGPTYPADDTYAVDGMSIVRTVVVAGGPGVRVIVSDGSSIPGRTAIVSESTLTTVAAATAFGVAYLAGRGATASGSVTLESVTTAEASWVLRRWRITDVNLGLSAADFECGGLHVTFDGAGKATIVATFGGPEQTAAHLLRRMASADGTLGR